MCWSWPPGVSWPPDVSWPPVLRQPDQSKHSAFVSDSTFLLKMRQHPKSSNFNSCVSLSTRDPLQVEEFARTNITKARRPPQDRASSSCFVRAKSSTSIVKRSSQHTVSLSRTPLRSASMPVSTLCTDHSASQASRNWDAPSYTFKNAQLQRAVHKLFES